MPQHRQSAVHALPTRTCPRRFVRLLSVDRKSVETGHLREYMNIRGQAAKVRANRETALCLRQREFDPGTDFGLTHHVGPPSRTQQRLQGHRARSLEIGRLGQSDVGVDSGRQVQTSVRSNRIGIARLSTGNGVGGSRIIRCATTKPPHHARL